MTQTELTPTALLTGKWKTYPGYKDSGVEWLGKIPVHWKVERLKNTVLACLNGIWGEEPVNDGSDIVCIRVADFDRTRNRVVNSNLTFRSISSNQQQNRMLEHGDLLLEKSGGGELQPVGIVVLYNLDIVAVSSNFIARMPVAKGFDPIFLCYVHSVLYSARLNRRSIKQNTGIQNLDSYTYLCEKVPLPTLQEQHTIAAFLDHETTRINTLITKKERLIELLQEKRAALISHAVTKGLDPSLPMKDSGVEWLGEIPKHWEVKRMKYVAKQETGHTPSRQHPEYWEDCTIPWISLADVWQLRNGHREYIEDTNEYISELGLANSSAQLLPAGTVIVSRTASVGFSGIMAQPMATTQDFSNWVCGPLIRSEFLLYVFRSMEQEFRRLVMGSTHQTIYMPDIRRFITPVPPCHEQDAIVGYIRKETAKIYALISKIREGVEKLKEYSSALISAAVTGKIDVRETISDLLDVR